MGLAARVRANDSPFMRWLSFSREIADIFVRAGTEDSSFLLYPKMGLWWFSHKHMIGREWTLSTREHDLKFESEAHSSVFVYYLFQNIDNITIHSIHQKKSWFYDYLPSTTSYASLRGLTMERGHSMASNALAVSHLLTTDYMRMSVADCILLSLPVKDVHITQKQNVLCPLTNVIWGFPWPCLLAENSKMSFNIRTGPCESVFLQELKLDARYWDMRLDTA